MSRPRRLVVPTVLALILGALAAVVGAPPAQAAVVRPFALNYNQAVHGDVTSVGNTSTACPTVGSPVDPFGEPIATCAQTQARTHTTATGINDSYYMRWADVDGSAATYNSSTASVTIPEGATVAFARLSWSGDTGTIRLADGTVSALPGCNTRQFLAGAGTSVLPAGTPESTSVRVTVGGAATAAVAPQVISRDALANVPASQPQFYSAYADVTSRFAGVATGSPVTVTVGNVWTPQGFGCYAGWNLHVVYDDPTDDLPLRRVQVVDGHVRQSSVDPATTATFSGFRSVGPSRVGVAAYEGDYNIAGDQLQINGTSVAEPLSSGTTTNFFVSNAEGSTSPSSANNLSVDVVTVDTTAIPVGATSAPITFATTGDTFLATTAVLSVPIAELKLRAATTSPGPFRSGQPVEYEVGVSAVGSDATGVEVEVPGLTDCTHAVPTLAAGTESTYTCTGTAPTDDATYDFGASGTDSSGGTLTADASVPLDVLTPGLEITATPDQAGYATDETISVDVSVENVGDSNVSDLALSTSSGTCSALSASAVAPAGTVTATCTATAPVDDDSVTIGVTGEDVLGGDVDDSVDVEVPAVGTVSGSVFVDRDRDGVLDAGESGPAAVTLALTGTDAAGQPVNRTATTAAGGGYELTAVRAGSYSLTQTQPAAYDDGEDTPGTNATSAGDDTFSVVLTSGQSSTGNLFAELPRPVAVGSVTASPTTIVAGASTTLSAEGEDAGGGYAGDVTADTTFATETPGGSCAGSTCTSTRAGSLVVTSSYDGAPGPTTTVTVEAGPAGSLEATSGGGQSAAAGDDFADPLVATVTDELDNPVSGVEVEFTLPATDGSATFAGGGTTRTVTTGADGRATSPLVRAARAGAVEATAVVDGLGSESFELTVVAGDPAQVDVVSGGVQTAAAGEDFDDVLVVAVLDAFDNPVGGADVVFTLPDSDGSATFAGGGTTRTVTTGADGRASSPVVRGARIGAVEATATTAGATGATFQLTVVAGDPAQVDAVSGGGQTAVSGADFADRLVASVSDELDNPVSGVEVEFNLPDTGGSATFAGGGTTGTATTGTDGRATSPLVRGVRAGVVEATATVDGAGGATYELTVTVGSPATVRAVSGTGQTVRTGEAFAAPLVASVVDAAGNGVSGVAVEFALPSSDGTATFADGGRTATATTGADGRATSPALTGGRAGALVATARVAGVAEAATYNLAVVSVVSRSADLGVELKVTRPGWARPGNAARLVVIATNDGNATATGATLTLNLPRGWVVRHAHDRAKRDGRRWTRTVDIPAGRTARFFVTVGLGSPKARKVTASARSSVADPNLGDNSVTRLLRPRSLR